MGGGGGFSSQTDAIGAQFAESAQKQRANANAHVSKHNCNAGTGSGGCAVLPGPQTRTHPPSTGGRNDPAKPHSLYRQGRSFGSSPATPALHAPQSPLPLGLEGAALNPEGRQGSCPCF